MENETIRIHLERQKKSKFSLELSSLKEEKLITLLQEMNDFDEIINFFMNNVWHKNREHREAHEKGLNEMEELKRFQGAIFGQLRGEN